MSTAPGWNGHRAQRARVIVATRLPSPCPRCGEPVTHDQLWDVDHLEPLSVAPHRAYDPSNWAAAHRACNRRHGQHLTTRAARLGPPSRDWNHDGPGPDDAA